MRCQSFIAAASLLLFAGGSVAAQGPALVFSGSTPIALVACDGVPDNRLEEPILRTATFMKQAADSRLRITYKDTASAASTASFSLFVVGHIDSVAVTVPTGLRMAFSSDGTGFYGVFSSFTLVGYADQVAAGSHVLTFVYDYSQAPASGFSGIGCYRSAEPFLIEIVEIPSQA
jgi:hypothetical protein